MIEIGARRPACSPRFFRRAACPFHRRALDWNRIKTAVLAVGASGCRDWRTRSIDVIEGEPREIRQNLAIYLPRDRLAGRGDVDAWIEETVALCRERFVFLFDLTANEERAP